MVTNGEPRPVAELLPRICAAAGVAGAAAARAARGRGRRRRRGRGDLDGAAPHRRSADDPVPRRAAVHRALVRPAADPSVLQWTPAVGLDEGFELLAASFADQAVADPALADQPFAG